MLLLKDRRVSGVCWGIRNGARAMLVLMLVVAVAPVKKVFQCFHLYKRPTGTCCCSQMYSVLRAQQAEGQLCMLTDKICGVRAVYEMQRLPAS